MRRFRLTRESYVSMYLPAKACKIREHSGLATVYLYPNDSTGQPAAVAFIGKADKPTWHLRFRSAEARTAKVAELFANLRAHAERKAVRRKEAATPHTLMRGSIIYNSWGYEQTNVDFYVVVGVSANYVQLREIHGEMIESTGSMSGRTRPFIGPEGVRYASDAKPTRHRVTQWNGTNSVNFKHGAGSEYRGTSLHVSWYA